MTGNIRGKGGRNPIDHIRDYIINGYTDSNSVVIHCTDSGETMRVTRTSLLFFPVFCGMEHLREIFIPGVSREDVELLITLPLTDTTRFLSSTVDMDALFSAK